VRGENRSCRDFADLDFALDHPSSDFFKGWTGGDFDAAQAWISACTEAPPSKQDQIRQSLLAQRRQLLQASGETARNEQAQAATREADNYNREVVEAAARAAADLRNVAIARGAAEAAGQQAAQKAAALQQETAQELTATARQAAYAECARSAAHQRYVAQTRVLEALDRESAAQQALEHEKRIEALSGVTNLPAQRSAAESLVSAQDDEHRWWTVYRQNGGSAANPQALTQSVTDPCE
jgi:hypothetical protein